MRTTLNTRRGRSGKALRGLTALLGAAAVTLTMVAGSAHGQEDKGGSVSADPITEPVPGDFRSWDELFAMQERLNRAADLISTARSGEEGQDDGYSGLVADPTTRRVELFWRGTVPPQVWEAIDEAQRDVPVVTQSARFSERELLNHGDLLLNERAVTGVSTAPDGSGLDVSVSVSEEEARRKPAIQNAAVPLTIEPFVTSEPLADRQNDTKPYYGGAVWSSPIRTCSTGFAVRLLVGGVGADYMLSAGHCALNGHDAHDGGGDLMGKVDYRQPTRDTLLIKTDSAGRVYTGSHSSNTTVPVWGVQSSIVGNFVCTSGAFTGHHCPVKVDAVNQTLVNPDGTKFTPMVKATRTAPSKPATGRGDSGGPVYSQTVMSTDGVALAMGTISAGSAPMGPCGLSTTCYHTVYYADITKTLQHYTNMGLNPSLILG